MSPTTASAAAGSSTKTAFEIEAGMRFAEADLLNQKGDFKGAEAGFTTAVTLKNDYIEAHYAISRLKKYQRGDPMISMMEKLRELAPTYTHEIQLRYWFCLGKMYEDIGYFGASWEAYRKANEIKFTKLVDVEKIHGYEKALVERITKFYHPGVFKDNAIPPSDITPVFIVGMPRSGSTLIEQVLSCHSLVHCVGEDQSLAKIIIDNIPDRDFKHFPDVQAQIGDRHLMHMRDLYLFAVSEDMPKDKKYIVNKMPANYWYLGFIKKMFPNAIFIHSVRDALDTCFSCYSLLFINDQIEYSYNLRTLGRYFNQYESIMAFWKYALPPKSVIDVIYELMVDDLEASARFMVEQMGLEWEDGLLDFHKSKRKVVTSSQSQVVQPIYTTSVARWENFKGFLGDLGSMIDEHRQGLPAKEQYWKQMCDAKANPNNWDV